MSNFFNPLIGSVFIVNSGGQQFLVTDLRSLFDSEKTTASIHFSKKFAESAGCLNFERDLSLENPINLRPLQEKQRGWSLHISRSQSHWPIFA